MCLLVVFFFKQKTAYELRISDWSSDVCSSDLHGPDALGSSYAPALKDSLNALSYSEFLDIVVNGRQNLGAGKESVMPAFAENIDVMLYIDHIYAYLKARADGKLGRGRSEEHTSELQSLMRSSYAVFCLKKKTN